nr:M23 family metallopeptidase [Sphingobacterium faecale]
MHSGVDLKGNTGDPIKATASGKVTFSGYEGEYGNVVKIKHKNGYETRYAHLSKTKVKKGETVDAGKTVGLLGSTGRSTGPHLHYEILKDDKKINPEKYFKL